MKFLRTEYAALVGMGLILLATVKHAFEVYTQTMYPSSEPSIWESIYIAIMLIAIDFAVLLFTIHDNRYAAQTFASLIFLLNLFAFWQNTSWGGWNESMLLYIPGLLFSGMFAYGLYYFTDVFSELLRSHKEQGDLQEKVNQAQETITSLQETMADQEQTISLLTNEKEELASELKEVDQEALESLRQQAASLSLVMDYLLQEGGYLNKSKEALRKGVEYWTKKSQEETLDSQGLVKLLTYTEALTKKLAVPS